MTSRFPVVLLALGLAFAADRIGSAAEPEPLKPMNLEKLNTARDEDEPHLATNALQLFYSSNAGGKWEILTARRRVANQPWPEGKPFVELEGKADYRGVFLTAEGKFPQRLYFATNKDPEKGDKGNNFDIYFLIKQGPRLDFTSPTAVLPVGTEAD